MSLPRSLSKDTHDLAAIHSPRWRSDDDIPVKNLNEHVPFFYTRTGAPLAIEGLFKGGHAFLVANGPSLLELDLSPLKQRWAMTLNNGAKTFRGNASCSVDDSSRFSLSMWLDPTIMKFTPMSLFERPLWDNRRLLTEQGWVQRWEQSTIRAGDCPNVIGFRRNEKFHAPRWLHEETINWGNHKKYGGGRSVLLAAIRILYLLGFRRVYLLGVDFEMSDNQKYHFDEDRTEAAIKGNMGTYAKMQAWFAELQPIFLKNGFHIHNCNRKSRLEAFPFMSYEEALARSVLNLGDPATERTLGMYKKIEEKHKETGKSEL